MSSSSWTLTLTLQCREDVVVPALLSTVIEGYVPDHVPGRPPITPAIGTARAAASRRPPVDPSPSSRFFADPRSGQDLQVTKADARIRTADPFITREARRRERQVTASSRSHVFAASRRCQTCRVSRFGTAHGRASVPSSYPRAERRVRRVRSDPLPPSPPSVPSLRPLPPSPPSYAKRPHNARGEGSGSPSRERARGWGAASTSLLRLRSPSPRSSCGRSPPRSTTSWSTRDRTDCLGQSPIRRSS